MKIEYRLYHRLTHKNGRVGDWVFDGVMINPEMVKFYVNFNTKSAEHRGKTVEHKIESREVGPWYEQDLYRVLKSAESKEVKDVDLLGCQHD